MGASVPELGLGTQLRQLLDRMDAAVGQACADVGLRDYRTRYSAVIKALVRTGPAPIRDLARAAGVTHSAGSQTVAEMRRAGLVELTPGADARQRVVQLTA